MAPLLPVASSEITPEAGRPSLGARPVGATDFATAFVQASQPLLSWPTTLQGKRWLDRTELDEVSGRINADLSSTTLLLGAPGSGKSALLARLGKAFMQAGNAVVAIKADLLNPSVDSLGALSESCICPHSSRIAFASWQTHRRHFF